MVATTRVIIPELASGERLDKVLAGLVEGCSRGRIQALIEQGLVSLDEESPRVRDKVFGGEVVELLIPDEQAIDNIPEPMDLDIIHEDVACIVLNKPAGLVVHPGAGNISGTLMNGLLAYDETLALLPRAGIVHRLDKDTSGLMVIAKTQQARLVLVDQLSEHIVRREYLAVVRGRVISGGTIDEPIARDSGNRIRMAVHPPGGKQGKKAITHYMVEQRFEHHTALAISLETGRTHQIRVHMSYVGWPLVGDRIYGGRQAAISGLSKELREYLQQFSRQALHARKLAFVHPVSEELVSFSCPSPSDILELLEQLS